LNRPALLDASFRIALERETARREVGPARTFLPRLRGRRLIVSIVTVAEVLEGAADPDAASTALQRFAIQGLHMAPTCASADPGFCSPEPSGSPSRAAAGASSTAMSEDDLVRILGAPGGDDRARSIPRSG
jgi:hypothetical protein